MAPRFERTKESASAFDFSGGGTSRPEKINRCQYALTAEVLRWWMTREKASRAGESSTRSTAVTLVPFGQRSLLCRKKRDTSSAGSAVTGLAALTTTT